MKAHVPPPADGKEVEQGASCRHHYPARRQAIVCPIARVTRHCGASISFMERKQLAGIISQQPSSLSTSLAPWDCRATMETQAWRDGELEEHSSHGRAPGDCPGVDHLQGAACGVSQACFPAAVPHQYVAAPAAEPGGVQSPTITKRAHAALLLPTPLKPKPVHQQFGMVTTLLKAASRASA